MPALTYPAARRDEVVEDFHGTPVADPYRWLEDPSSKETRAWTVRKGSKAPQAAGEIHTDFEKGFIRAFTSAYDDYVTLGGEVPAKEAGKARDEGKEYVVQDGDVMLFKFNV